MSDDVAGRAVDRRATAVARRATAVARTPTAVAGTATAVTVYEDRAEVTRAADVTLREGLQRIRVTGIGPYVDDRTVQARLPADAGRVVAARVHRRAVADSDDVASLRESLGIAQREHDEAVRADERAADGAARIRELTDRWAAAAAQVASSDAVDAWRDALARLATEADHAARAAAAAAAIRSDSAEALDRARLRLAQAETRTPRIEAHVEVQVEAERAGATRLEVTYRTPAAAWRPEHLARLRRSGDTGDGQASAWAADIATMATIWQATGEVWDDVALTCSTARPSSAASAPPVRDDVLRSRRKTDEERKTVVVEQREQEVVHAGVEGARLVEAMPGIDDGGAPLVYRASEPVSVPSDGEPHRVEVERRTVDVSVGLVLLPEAAAAAHVRATGTLGGSTALLAGPVRLARAASVVGEGVVGYVAPGEPFELGFGVDDGLRIRRRVDERHETAGVTGGQRVERRIHLYVSNTGDTPREAEVVERVPVSELEQVRVEVTTRDGFAAPDRDGFAKGSVALEPGATLHLELAYELTARGNVVLPT